jgi:hypothetical protein
VAARAARELTGGQRGTGRGGRERALVRREPQLRRAAVGLVLEAAVRAGVAGRRLGLRMLVQARADPVELRRVEARQLDEADLDGCEPSSISSARSESSAPFTACLAPQ